MPPIFKWDVKNLRVDQRTYNFSNNPPTFKWDIKNLRVDQSRGDQSCVCYEEQKNFPQVIYTLTPKKKKKPLHLCRPNPRNLK